MEEIERNENTKVLTLYLIITALFIIFLFSILKTILNDRSMPSRYAINSSKAYRGDIISADGFHLARTKKLYKAVVNKRYIDPDKKELFIELFSIYSGINTSEIRNKLNSAKGVIVLSYEITEKKAKYLKKLSYELRRLSVFKAIKNKKSGLLQVHGLNIIESGESRLYPYNDLLTPIIGYPNKMYNTGFTYVTGIKGLERKYNDELTARQDGIKKGTRDVNSYIILNKNSHTRKPLNGLTLKLTVFTSLQIKIEQMLDKMKEKLQAKQIMLAVIDINTSNVITIASSNRFSPKRIKRIDYPSLRPSMIEYSFEPGSVIKPVTLSLLLNKGLITPSTLVNGHNGKFKIRNKIITDEHRFSWLSAENVIVHSSNIGIAQLAQKLSGYDFYDGLLEFGFTKKSTPDLMSERLGSVPSAKKLDVDIYKATCSYGYGMKTNLMQLLRAYSVFNNNGKMLTPRIVDYFIDSSKNMTIATEWHEPIQVIRKSTAQMMKKILIKTVNEGTGRKAIIKGLEIGGKTGTAHLVEKRKYIDKYNTSFIGFANDKQSKYTIGVVVIQPKSSQFASKTAVPVFKKTVELMIEDGYLKPDVIK